MMYRRKTRDEDIPIKIGGWDGRFVVDRNAPPQIKQHKNDSSTYEPRDVQDSSKSAPKYATGNKFFGYHQQPEKLPVVWDGTFVGQNYRAKGDRNQSNSDKFFAYNTETEVLPVQWSGKFQLDPNDVRMKPERNNSDVRDYADERNFITAEERAALDREIAESKARGDDVVWSNDRNFGKSGWNGKFQLDPTDVRIKPERNRSDLLDYADERNFITAEERAALDREIAESKARGDDVVWSNDRNFGKTGWNGKFQLDPNDVRIKPERNQSDCRDYADARNFYERTK